MRFTNNYGCSDAALFKGGIEMNFEGYILMTELVLAFLLYVGTR